MITLFEKYKEFEGFKVGDILVSPYDSIIIDKMPSSRMLQTIHFMFHNLHNIKFFGSSSYNYDELSRYRSKDDVEIMNIIECLDKYPNMINLVKLIFNENNRYKELIDVWKSYEEFEKYIEADKYNL